MLKEETIEFLANMPPFDMLAEDELEGLAEDIVLEYYPRGVKILSQNGPPSEFLRLIKKGAVKVYLVKNDEEIVIDFRSEGDHFGMLSLISGDRSRANVVAVEDTICYLISREKVTDLLQKNPSVNEYFMRSFFIEFLDKSYGSSRRQHVGLGDSERRLFTTPVGGIIAREPVTASQDVSIQEASALMSENRVSSVILLDGSGVPSGIITDRDLRDKVVSRGRDISEPAKRIMSTPLIRVDADELCFEVLLKMMRYKIHHLLVVEKGGFRGVVTNHDFMLLQGSSPTVLVKEIEEARDGKALSGMMPKLYKTVSSLMFEGARAVNIAGLITEIGEKLILRGIGIAEKELGTPPVQYTVFLFGGSGRRELTLTLNIRIGVIVEDTNNISLLEAGTKYLENLSASLGRLLSECCPGSGGSILHKDHIKTFTGWKDYFNAWKYEVRGMPVPHFFDMRHIKGDEAPVEALREHLFEMAASSEDLMDLIATVTVDNRPPLGFFRRFVVEKSGEHRNELDLTAKGIRPLVDTVRVFSIEKGYRETSTVKRLRHLRERYGFEYAEDIEHAVNFLDSLLMNHQLEQIERGLLPDSFINPEKLSTIEKKTLREIFNLTARVYDIIEKNYRTERIR